MKRNVTETTRQFINGTYTKADVDFLADSIRDEETSQEMGKIMDDVWDECQNLETSSFLNEQYKHEAKQLLRKIEKRNRFAIPLRYFKYVAAIALIALISTGTYKIYTSMSSIEVEYCEVRVKNGETKQIHLPDNSIITLNSGSYLRYPDQFINNQRLIELDGEAFIDVKKDKDAPFIVRTNSIDIKVLGTSFNVKSYNDDEQLIVSVQTGKVQINSSDTQTVLQAEDQFILNKQDGEFQKRKESANQVKSWMRGALYFNKTPIRSVVKELERAYNCQIDFDPAASKWIFNKYIYGQHDNISLESVLKSIKYATGIQYRKEGDRYILYGN